MKKKLLWLIPAVVIVVAAAALLIARPSSEPEPSPSPEPTSTLSIGKVSRRSIPTAKPSSANKKGVAIPGWSSFDLPANVTEADVELYNPTDNDGLYYLVFELRLQDTGEALFTTGLVPPGTLCNHVELTRALEPGRYAGVIHVQPVRMSDQSLTNNADISLTINVS